MTATTYIALGSNLGDRAEHLQRAVEALRIRPDIAIIRVSSYHETEPVGGPPGQGRYFNAAAELRTELEPADLLRVLLDVEQQLGRVRDVPQGPRTIDLDLLLYGDRVCAEPNLIVPHPRMHERRFVLGPLAEVAPLAFHSVLHRTVRDLLARLPDAVPPQSRELAGLRTLVTGSTGGIGRAIALALAAAGADVLIHGRRQQAAEAVVGDVQRYGVRSRFLLADLRQPDECHRLVQTAWDEWAGIDVWINNAGADILTGDAPRWSFERKLQELWAVDVQATVLMARDVGAQMRQRGGGIIVNMGWDQADTGMEGDSGHLFGATKGAVMAFTKGLAVSLAPQVRVNCVAPGWVRTAWGEQASAVWQERVRREVPLGRWGTPEDVAGAVRWLLSPAAEFVTGQVIRVNGGAVR